ncbi:MAG: sugar ABC transporter permease [Anaerolineae bacterium]|nr:sugar ABC transporter permease [Anaerolineae bacterium]
MTTAAGTHPLNRRKKINLLPYLLILPTFVFIALFTIYPTFSVLQSSQEYYHPNRPNRTQETDLNLPGIEEASRSIRGPHDVGLAYFRAMLDPSSPEGEVFFQVMGNTIIYTVITVPVTMLLAFVFAVMVNRSLRWIGLARVAFFYPTMLPLVSAATIWLFFFTPDYGLWNVALKALGYSGPQNWIINRSLGLWALMIVSIWKNAGYLMIFYLAGLQGLPQDVYEAADLDGAGWLTKMFRITLPLLRRTTLFVSVIAIITSFQNVDHAFVLTNELVTGEADLLLYEIYKQRFVLGNYGFANALTVVMIVVLLVFTMTNFYLSERRSDEQ